MRMDTQRCSGLIDLLSVFLLVGALVERSIPLPPAPPPLRILSALFINLRCSPHCDASISLLAHQVCVPLEWERFEDRVLSCPTHSCSLISSTA